MDCSTKWAFYSCGTAVVEQLDIRSDRDVWDVGSSDCYVVRNVKIQNSVTVNGAASVTKKHA